MELSDGIVPLGTGLTTTLGILVLFVGRRINEKSRVLREFSIPDPVTGGLIFSILFGLVYWITGIAIEFDLSFRDFLLVYFFTTIGINASFKDLMAGGKPLLILLAITIFFMIVQNLTGISIALLFGQPGQVGMLGGSVSLIGGHGTAIAWAPRIGEEYSIANAMEIGIACATFGLILASLIGGPIAKFLIDRYKLTPDKQKHLSVGVRTTSGQDTISSMGFLDAILAIHICIILGLLLNKGLVQIGLELPTFVPCLFAGIFMTNVVPKNFPRLTGTNWPSRSASMALIAEMSLGTFLAMSLMSMQLWTLVDLAGPILTILLAQCIMALLFIVFIVFPAMGKNYDATVVCAGFGGFCLGATPTAMANMSAVTVRYGASHLAFIIVPLVCAFFIDLVNAILIPYFLSTF